MLHHHDFVFLEYRVSLYIYFHVCLLSFKYITHLRNFVVYIIQHWLLFFLILKSMIVSCFLQLFFKEFFFLRNKRKGYINANLQIFLTMHCFLARKWSGNFEKLFGNTKQIGLQCQCKYYYNRSQIFCHLCELLQENFSKELTRH